MQWESDNEIVNLWGTAYFHSHARRTIKSHWNSLKFENLPLVCDRSMHWIWNIYIIVLKQEWLQTLTWKLSLHNFVFYVSKTTKPDKYYDSYMQTIYHHYPCRTLSSHIFSLEVFISWYCSNYILCKDMKIPSYLYCKHLSTVLYPTLNIWYISSVLYIIRSRKQK